jgi:hypothetical protein
VQRNFTEWSLCDFRGGVEVRNVLVAVLVLIFADRAFAAEINDLNVGDKVRGSAAPISMYTCAGGRVSLAVAMDTQKNKVELINVTDMKHPVRQTRPLNVFYGVVDTFKAYDGEIHKYVRVTNASGDDVTFYSKPNYGSSRLKSVDPEAFSTSSAFHQLLVKNDLFNSDGPTKTSVYECYPSLHQASEIVANELPEKGDFERIFEYTLFDKTLPDGKHPVWIYYQSRGEVLRVEMPSMDMCVVTPASTTDMGVINSKNYDVIDTSSPLWNLAHDIWKAAFQRYTIVGTPRRC